MRVVNDKIEIIFDLLKLKKKEYKDNFGEFILNIKHIYFSDVFNEDEKMKIDGMIYSLLDGILLEYHDKQATKEMIHELQLKLITRLQELIDLLVENKEEFNNDIKRV